ncbi:MAG: type II toxin-antitoxin system VapC family toxin [Verrucomicrobiota bacterium]
MLDTNILAELRKGERCDERVRKWAESVSRERHFVSVLSLGEIRKGIEILRRKSPDQCSAFEKWLTRLEEDYEDDILPVTPQIADRWGRMQAQQSLPVIDSLLAATSEEFKLIVVTRNIADFERTGVECLNPFDE